MSEDPRRKVDELRVELARNTWNVRRQQVIDSWKATLVFGQGVLGALVVVGVAVLAAFLGFVSANAERLAGSGDLAVSCFVWILGGVSIGLLAGGTAYLAQYVYTVIDSRYRLDWGEPYVVDTAPGSLKLLAKGLHALAVTLVVAGYAALFFGAWRFSQLVQMIVKVAGS